jgi:WD40 repeat protein
VAGKVYLWDLSTLQKAAELDGHEHHGIKDLAFSPDGQTLASASNNVILWDVETFQRRKTISWLSSHVHSVWSVDFSPDGQTIATASDDGSLRLWDPVTGVQRLALIEAIPVFTGGGTLTSCVEFSSDGEWLVSTWLGYKIQLWPADSPDSDDETLGMR